MPRGAAGFESQSVFMKISYDAEVDALSILFRDTTVTTKHLAEGIAADYDSDGRLAGIEILDGVNSRATSFLDLASDHE